jgi:hypothetical protein
MTRALEHFSELGIVVRGDGRTEQRVPCPQCGRGDRDDALGVNLETRVFHCFRCGWSGRAGDSARREQRRVVERREQDVRRPPDLGAIWKRTVPLRGTLGEVYLTHRHCALPPADSAVRYLPSTDRYPPSLCALVTDATSNNPLTLHFTRLRVDGLGKAGGDRDKLLLRGHPKRGGVIRLWPDDAVTHGLAIAEGIETALSVAHAFTPVWAAVDAGNLAAFPVLAGIECLTIFADRDEAGLTAARACGQRWADAGREVELRIPEHGDFNDVVAA